MVEILLCAHSRRSQLIYVTVCGPSFIPSESSRSCGFMFSLLSQCGCTVIYCILLPFTRETKRLDWTDEFIPEQRYFSLFLLLTTSRIWQKFCAKAGCTHISMACEWKIAVFVFASRVSLFTGDLLTAKELLAQMKYFTNIEEKVKDRITEGCWGKIVSNLQL